MNEDPTFIVGEILPRIASVSVHDHFRVAVTWDVGSRAGRSDVVDLGPAIMTYKVYAPLRDNPDLFRTVHVINYGTALGWGDGEIDMSAEGVEDLAEQAMTAADFRSFMERHQFSQEAAAAQLGISRRQVNYYLSSKAIPRTLALACGYLDLKAEETPKPSSGEAIAPYVQAVSSGSGLRLFGGAARNPIASGTVGSVGKRGAVYYVDVQDPITQGVAVVSLADVESGKADLASLAANKPVLVKP